MKRIALLSAATGLALIATGPAFAQTAAPTAPTATPPATAPTVGSEARESAVEPEAPAASTTPPANSQGADNASVNGLANASPNSALAGAGKPELDAVKGGTAVVGTGGTSIGTVTGRVKNQSGATVGLQVKLADGTTTTIPATDLTLSGTTLATTWVPKK